MFRMSNGKDDTARSTSSTVAESDQSHSLSRGATEALSLQCECGHSGHILTLYLKAHGDYVLIGILLRSVTFLQCKCTDRESSLDERRCRGTSTLTT